MEHVVTFTVEISRGEDRFETLFTDSRDGTRRLIETHKIDMENTEMRRTALNGMFYIIGSVIRKKVFPEDTLLYKTETLPNGSIRCTSLGYPADKSDLSLALAE